MPTQQTAELAQFGLEEQEIRQALGRVKVSETRDSK